tara:strand:- start:253 stop:954 length:702 start_codon:yes stop_codon:yes gene_type:complete
MNLLVIPARFGSKRIPKKNIKIFKGKPIIEWVIKEAVKSNNIFKKIIVSTDSEEIKDIALKAGAEVPFLRPKNLSDDYTTTAEVIIHAINWFKQKRCLFSNVCCLYPTATFIKSLDLIKASSELDQLNEDMFIFSATSFAYPIQRAFYLDQKGFSKMFNPLLYNARTQDLISSYHDAGQFYIASSNTWLTKTDILQNSKPYIIERWRAQDIDNQEDWEMAELIFECYRKKNTN